MSFVAAPPAPAAAVPDQIEGDGWWPALSIAAFRVAVRLGTIVTDARAREELLNAGLEVAQQLAKWRADREAEGVTALGDIGDPVFGGETMAALLWRRAVHSTAAANLAETHNDITATDGGRAQRDELVAAAPDHRRAAIVAVRGIVRRGPSRVALL